MKGCSSKCFRLVWHSCNAPCWLTMRCAASSSENCWAVWQCHACGSQRLGQAAVWCEHQDFTISQSLQNAVAAVLGICFRLFVEPKNPDSVVNTAATTVRQVCQPHIFGVRNTLYLASDNPRPSRLIVDVLKAQIPVLTHECARRWPQHPDIYALFLVSGRVVLTKKSCVSGGGAGV